MLFNNKRTFNEKNGEIASLILTYWEKNGLTMRCTR